MFVSREMKNVEEAEELQTRLVLEGISTDIIEDEGDIFVVTEDIIGDDVVAATEIISEWVAANRANQP